MTVRRKCIAGAWRNASPAMERTGERFRSDRQGLHRHRRRPRHRPRHGRGAGRHGATVVLSGRTRATLEETAAAIGEQAIVVTADVSKEADVLALRDAVLERFGRIDVLVNNAGVNAIFKGIERTNLAEWQDIIDVNLTGVFLCCKHIGGAIGEGGSVINVSSVAGHGGLPRSVPYCASKGGVEMFTKALALDWAKRKVRVNTLAPAGSIPT